MSSLSGDRRKWDNLAGVVKVPSSEKKSIQTHDSLEFIFHKVCKNIFKNFTQKSKPEHIWNSFEINWLSHKFTSLKINFMLLSLYCIDAIAWNLSRTPHDLIHSIDCIYLWQRNSVACVLHKKPLNSRKYSDRLQ